MDKIKVFITCSGLGNIKRGFESFTQECFAALSQEPDLDISLYQGGGDSINQEITLWNFPRNHRLTALVSKLTGKSIYFIEQVSFAVSLLPHIQLRQPDVIYFSDGSVGNFLWHWRRLTKQKYKLLFCNGAPFFPPGLPRCDRIQQVTPIHLQTTIEKGVPAAKQILVPYGINISPKLEILSSQQQELLRQQLGLPQHRPIILSVGAINKSHKRMDYLIRETATLSKPCPYLLLLGQQDGESEEIIQLGNQLLGTQNFQVKTVNIEEVIGYYRVADVFVLASLDEGFGRVFLEAMSWGLPCLAHDSEVTRFVLGQEGYFANFKLPGTLADLISQVLAAEDNDFQRHQRHESIYQRFSWKKLRSSYVQMIQNIARETIIYIEE